MSNVPTRPAIFYDPYFDGDQQQQQEVAPPPDANRHPGYRDAGTEQTANGRSVLQVIRPGPRGLRGTIIPRSTPAGIPQGFRPHATSNIEVNIDPHIPGQSTRVRLGDINEQIVRQATQLAEEITPEPFSRETQRLRSSAIMHGIAGLAQRNVPQPAAPPPLTMHQDVQTHSYPPAPPPQQSGYVQANHLGDVGHRAPPPQPRRRVSPLSAFNQAPPPQVVDETNLRPIQLREAAGHPQVHVTFELEHFGVHEAYYHDVVIQEGFLVLVMNLNYNGPKYFPPTQADAPMLALNVTGTDEIYSVQTTGVHFQHANFEYCVLMIDRVGHLPPEGEGEY